MARAREAAALLEAPLPRYIARAIEAANQSVLGLEPFDE